MTEPLEPVVPGPLRRLLGADEPDEPVAGGLAVMLLTVRPDGWPHQSMLSPGELVALDDRRIGMALWPSSTAAAALSPQGRATLSAVLDGTSYLVRVIARRLADLALPLSGRRACFAADVEAVAGDRAPYATLETGVRYRLHDPAATMARWSEVRAALRTAARA